jgi:hypothetical protein
LHAKKAVTESARSNFLMYVYFAMRNSPFNLALRFLLY